MPALTVQAPGKTILFGEHAVVYSYPAIAVPINSIRLSINIIPLPQTKKNEIRIFSKETKINNLLRDLPEDNFIRQAIQQICVDIGISDLPSMEIHTRSTIPISSGLGSSAAFAVALSKALLGFLGFNASLEKINELAFNIEILQHGTPSGIDNTVITYNKPVFYQKEHQITFLDIQAPISFIIADTGIRVPTKQTVLEVRNQYNEKKNRVTKIFEDIGQITINAVKHLELGDLDELGKLMNQNHQLLQELNVSSNDLDNLVSVALSHHALGAKLCGGGKGGSIVAIAKPQYLEMVNNSLLMAGAVTSFIFQISPNFHEEINDHLS